MTTTLGRTVPGHELVWPVIEQHVAHAAELVAGLRPAASEFCAPGHFEGVCRRAEAHLDALRIAGPAGIVAAERALPHDPDVAAVLAQLLAETPPTAPGGALVSARILALVRSPDVAMSVSAWLGLRLASPRHLPSHLAGAAAPEVAPLVRAVAADVLAFHRLPTPSAAAGEQDAQAETCESEFVAWLLTEAAGRGWGAWDDEAFRAALRHSAAAVRAAALRAAARRSTPALTATCRAAADGLGPDEALEFLGVVGDLGDVPLLEGVAGSQTVSPAARAAALHALGRLGYVQAMPALLSWLGDTAVGEAAAAAVARITGATVARGTPPDPPPDLSADDRDLYDPVPPIDAGAARRWWAEAATRFDPEQRWQLGLCVSRDPLGPVFGQLPPPAAYDVYLRERARSPVTPDWELDTWPWRWRDPGGRRAEFPPPPDHARRPAA